MYKRIMIMFMFLITVFVVSPVRVEAFSIRESVSDSVLIMTVEATENSNTGAENCTKEEREAILGCVEDPNSVAWLLQQIFNLVKIAGPILVVLLSSFDFILVIVNSDEDAMKKAGKKLSTRLILAVLLFFVPTLVQLALEIFGFTSFGFGIH